jgi:transcriptional regulator with XRE-family HTH domain
MTIVKSERARNSPTEIGERVRLWRLRRRLTQTDVAEVCGVTQASLSNYELGKRELPISVAIRIAGRLDVPLSEFIDVPDILVSRNSRLGQVIEALVDRCDEFQALNGDIIEG